MEQKELFPNVDDRLMLQRIKQNVQEVEADAEVWLYGSRARQDARRDSDWDVLVLSSKPKLTFQEEESNFLLMVSKIGIHIMSSPPFIRMYKQMRYGYERRNG